VRLKYIIGILALLLLTVTTVSAETLTTANEDYFKGKIEIQVNYDETNGKIDVKYVSDGVPEEPIGIDTFYYNLDDETHGITNVMEGGVDATSSWHRNFDGLTADGFGNFLSHQSLNSAGTGGISDPIVFTLASSFPLGIDPNEQGHRVAVHIRFENDKSTWVTNGNDTTEIPEFPSIALPVAAIMGIMFIVGSRRKE
jgi:hypothetical protein